MNIMKSTINGLLLMTISSVTYAAGYSIIEQSVSGLGRAFAGSAAVAEDASSLFYNPAGLTYLTHSEMIAGMHYIAPKIHFEDSGSTISPNFGGAALSGGSGGDAGKNALIPNIYFAHKINNDVSVGMGINVPFGLVSEYDETWQGRYHAIKSDLKTINVNPSLAFKASNDLSLGFGLNLQYIDLTLSQAVDFGSLIGGIAPQALDGKAVLSADDWSWGYNFGLLYQLTEQTRLGFSYRSKISHHLKGKGRFILPNNQIVQTIAPANGFINGQIDGKVDIPENSAFAIHHQLNEKWAVSSDVIWTKWSRFQRLAINSDDSIRLNSSKDEKWKDSYRVGLGLTYKQNQTWTWRSGIAFDNSPVSNGFRTARIPDENRTWFSIGSSYHYSNALVIDTAYTYITIKDSAINETLAAPVDHQLKGKYKSSINILSVQLRWLFL